MTKITPTQETILKAAADREDGAIHPLPKNIKGGAEKKVIGSLKAKGLAEHPDGDENLPLRITDTGRTAIGLDPLNTEPADDSFEQDVTEAETSLGIETAANDSETETASAENETPAPDKGKTPKEPRPGTKKARMFEMLRRTEGATTKQIMDETNWSHHSVRGAIALAKRAGWNITTHKHRMVGPNQTGAKGSYTTYFLQTVS